jgi:N-acetylglucosamine-6-phosphate deacetylase
MHPISGIDCATGRPIRLRIEAGSVSSVDDLVPSPDPGMSSLPFICPGFFDLQLNGYAGIDYSDPRLAADGVEAAAERMSALVRAVARSGTTRHVATIITGAADTITANCAAIAGAVRGSPLLSTAVAGIHVEGPFISAQDGPRGAHDPHHVRDPSWDEFRRWQDAAEGLIRVVTLAPERDGAIELIERLADAGVVAAIGHTAATQRQIQDAIAAGARLSTHLGNGSHAVLPRLKNYIWEQLGSDALWASIIADGFHLPPAVIRTMARAKGFDRLVLISDAAYLAGAAPGIHRWGETVVEVHRDGHLGVAGTDFLAGAGHLLDHDIACFIAATGASVPEAVALCTVNPVRLLGLPASMATLAPGAPATLSVFRFNLGAARLAIETCVVAGEELYSHAA